MTTIRDISAGEAAALLAQGQAVLIDVREPDEFRAEHVPYAMSVPLAGVGAMLPRMGLPGERTVIFQCLKGGRGAQACVAVGEGDVRNLVGGIEGWKAAGLPVTGVGTAGGAGLPVMRQVQIVVGLLVLA